MPKTKDLDTTIYNLHEYGINPLSREIYLGAWDGNTDEEPGIDYRNAMTFIKNITFMQEQSDKPITIHQASMGGDLNYGMAIYDAILQCPCHITMIAYAHARSMSSITLQAADHRIMMANAYFMIHHGTMVCEDTYKGCISYLRWSEKDAGRMMDIYTSRCKLKANQILLKLDRIQVRDMSLDEAVRHGLAYVIREDYVATELSKGEKE